MQCLERVDLGHEVEGADHLQGRGRAGRRRGSRPQSRGGVDGPQPRRPARCRRPSSSSRARPGARSRHRAHSRRPRPGVLCRPARGPSRPGAGSARCGPTAARPRRVPRPTRARRTSAWGRRPRPRRCRARRRARTTPGPCSWPRRSHGLLLLGGERLIAGPVADALGVTRASLRPWMAVITTPLPESSTSATDHDSRPPLSLNASYRTTPRWRSEPADSARRAATSCRRPTTSSGRASGSPAYDGVRRQPMTATPERDHGDQQAENRQNLHIPETRLPR